VGLPPIEAEVRSDLNRQGTHAHVPADERINIYIKVNSMIHRAWPGMRDPLGRRFSAPFVDLCKETHKVRNGVRLVLGSRARPTAIACGDLGCGPTTAHVDSYYLSQLPGQTKSARCTNTVRMGAISQNSGDLEFFGISKLLRPRWAVSSWFESMPGSQSI
jgi:hypothetical protein